MANKRRRLQGSVVGNKMEKTVVVEVESAHQHRLYRKVVRRNKRYMVHDESNALNVGDVVQIIESRPLSKRKRWAVETVISQGEQE